MGPLVIVLACKVRCSMWACGMSIINAVLRLQVHLAAKTAIRWSLVITFLLAAAVSRVSRFSFGCCGFASRRLSWMPIHRLNTSQPHSAIS